MPLLKGRFLSPVRPPTNVDPGTTVYTIEHTKEQFISKNEYEKRVALYSEPVWTCQCTGQIKLSHEEAWNSEEKIQSYLKENYGCIFEKPVLELVHHSTEVLDTLTDRAWRSLHQAFVTNEKVTLKVKAQGKTIEGTVTKIDKSGHDEVSGTSSTSGSPSSNKENVENKKGADGDSPGRKQAPKLLPYRYNIKLDQEDKIINGIPAEDLVRCERPPPKDLIKTFIRSSAWRGGYQTNSPWVVNEDLVAKYSLPNKFADLFISPTKMAELGKKALKEGNKPTAGKKRKLSSSTKAQGPSNKKLKTDNTDKKQSKLSLKPGSPKKAQSSPKKPTTPKRSPRKNATPKKLDLTPSRGKRTPRKDLAESSEDQSGDSSSDEDISLAELKEKSPVKSPAKSPTKSVVTLADLKKKLLQKEQNKPGEKKKRGRPRKAESGPPTPKRPRGRPKKEDSLSGTPKKSKESPKKSRSPNKKLKQMTLFDLKGKKKGTPTNSPRKSPTKTPKSPKRLPPIVLRLQKAMKADQKNVVFQLVARCAKELTQAQVKLLPAEVHEPVQKKRAKIEEKKKIEKMTPEEKKVYFKKKMKDAMKKRMLANKRCEDTELDLKPLPIPKLVPTPDGLANEVFGDVTMVTEFINCYQGLFMPESDKQVRTDLLMMALASSKDGCGYLFEVLTILLQTLLQDEIAEDYEELNMRMSEIAVNQYTAAELVRLCLRNSDAIETSDDDEEIDDDTVPVELLEMLETTEMYELQPQEKTRILICLCHRIMDSYSVQDYLNEQLAATSELWRKRLTIFKEKKEERKKTKENKKLAPPTKETKPDGKDTTGEGDKKVLTMDSFYGTKPAEEEAEEAADLATVVKRRRVLAAKAAEEKRKKDREERIRREKEYEEYQKQKADETFEKTFFSKLETAKLVQRQAPIGTDRNHSRYWIFHKSTPGLFIEKGWASTETNYCVRPKDNDDSSDSSSSDDGESDGEKESTKGRPRRKGLIGKTLPHIGQNLWFMYDSVEEIDQVVANLHPLGIRESALQAELKKQYERLVKSIKTPKSEEDKEETKVTAMDLVEGFQHELIDFEARIRNGGLGGVLDFHEWEKRVLAAKTIQEFGALMKESAENILNKFLKGILTKMKKPSKIEAVEEDEEKEEDVAEGEKDDKKDEGKAALVNTKWHDDIDPCPTFSRLHVLLGVLDSCIKWEKSAENAKCKICRKKGNEDHLLLCDECNQAFHLYCLRPALLEVPPGDWFCPACVPLHKRRATRNRNYRELAGESSEEEDSENEQAQETTCAVCDNDVGDLVGCTMCPSVFHMDCHEPQLRHTPRSSWRCMQCKSGVRIRRSKRSAGKKRKHYVVPDELDEEDEDEVEEPPAPKKSSRSTRNSHRQQDFTITPDATPDTTPEPKPTGRSTRRSGGADYSELCEPDTRGVGLTRQTSRNKVTNRAKVDPSKVIEKVLYRLQRHKSAWPFREPVDPQEVPDYYTIVKNPVDMFTMREKNKAEEYKTLQEFVDDVALLFNNGYMYNKPDSLVGSCIPPVEKVFKDLFKSNFTGCTYSRDPELSQVCMVNGDDNLDDEEVTTPPQSRGLGHDHAYYASPRS